jgi:hypothetical protein
MKPRNRANRSFNHVLALLIAAMALLAPNIAPVRMAGVMTAGDRVAQNLQTTYFTNLSFSSSRTGPAMDYFPVGTTEVFARWNFVNIPGGTTLLRQWYRNGTLFIQKSEAWNIQNWGSTGYLNHISIFDFTEGLAPGYYHVVISLMSNLPAAQVVGDFVIADKPIPGNPTNGTYFSDLTMSTHAAGPNMSVFPAGTPLVSVRWNYSGIPLGTTLQRDWYLNGILFKTVQEPWSPYWGTTGRLTHIALYDYERGLASGNYRLVVFLKEKPQIVTEISFTIGGSSVPNPQVMFSNLTFSTSANGPSAAIFPRGTTQIFARWNYNSIPANVTVLRRWYRNGVLYIEKQEPWSLGPAGTVQNVSIYDFDYGLLPGDYYVEMSLIAHPETFINGYFTIS